MRTQFGMRAFRVSLLHAGAPCFPEIQGHKHLASWRPESVIHRHGAALPELGLQVETRLFV